MTMWEKVNSGYYSNSDPYPSKVNNPNYNEDIKSWRDKENLLLNKFKEDLEEEFGTQNWDKKDKAYALAWQEGHSYGLSEILYHYTDYVDTFFK
jgi:hypothetical protein